MDYQLFTLTLLFLAGIGFFVFWFFRHRSSRLSNNHNNNYKPAYPIDLLQGSSQIIKSLWKVNKAILSTLDFEKLTEEVVSVVLQELNYLQIGYRISVLTLVDRKEGIVRRISFSPTPEALEILKRAKVRFQEIKIPLKEEKNLLVKSIKKQKIYVTHDLSDVFYPEKTREIWRNLQKEVGIKTSLVFPLIIHGESIGAMIFSLSKTEKEISDYEKGILAGFTDAVAVAIENANLYRKLRYANQQLKLLDKQKDEFISIAAHELRAPMTAIKGYLSMILEGDAGEVPPKIAEYLKEATEGNERLIRLVNNMLNVGRIEEGRMIYQMGKVALGRVVETVFNEFKVEAEKKQLEFKFEMPENLNDEIYVDQDRIHEVVSNLVSNAVKYTDKGVVAIKLSQPQAQIIRLEVSDTGPGISTKDKEKLFQKFSRVESSAGKAIGTGLGLYISKLLIEKFGGRIGFESELGKGSSFWFELPVKN